MFKKGLAELLIIGIIIILVGVGFYFVLIQKPKKSSPLIQQVSQPTKTEKVFAIYERDRKVFKSDIDGKNEVGISSLDYSADSASFYPSNNGKYVIKATQTKLELLAFNQPEIVNTVVVELSDVAKEYLNAYLIIGTVVWSNDDSKIAYVVRDYDGSKTIYKLFIIDKDGKNRKLVKTFYDLTYEVGISLKSFNSSQNKIYYNKILYIADTNGTVVKKTYEIIDLDTNRIKQLDGSYILSSDFNKGYRIKDSNIVEKDFITDSEKILYYDHEEKMFLMASSPKDDFLVFTTIKNIDGSYTLYLFNLKNNKIDILFKPEFSLRVGDERLFPYGKYLYIVGYFQQEEKYKYIEDIIDIESKTIHLFNKEDKNNRFLGFGIEE